MSSTTRVPLAKRPRDLAYFFFFLIHIPTTLLVDAQPLYPQWLSSIISGLPKYYVDMSNDPLLGSALGYYGEARRQAYNWFRWYLIMEVVFQLPVFLIALRGLWRGTTSIYLLLLIYGASTATTTLACIADVLATPVTPTPTRTPTLLLLSSYIPFFIAPFIIAIDMAFRLHKLVSVRAPNVKSD
ncbi:transmembrane protein 6/97 [Cerioporus squamosus]|nr:transmembrane protein 6/97 [Cerioporus squamosus]